MKSFNQIRWHDFQTQWFEKLKSEITSKGKEYILQIDKDEFANYLEEKYKLEPLSIDFDSEEIDEPIKKSENVQDQLYRRSYTRDVYWFTVAYNFTGSPILFQVQPGSWIMTSHDIHINEHTNKVSIQFKIVNQNVEEFEKEKSECIRRAFANVNNINQSISAINNGLRNRIESHIEAEKKKYQSENSFFEAIKVKTNKKTDSIFSPPTIKKKIIPQPKPSKKREFSSVPTMSKEMYSDVIKIIYDSGKSMEKKPSLYLGKDEEGLRDQFLFILETRYEGTTATGETFNKKGKGDIILKYSDDGSNLFVAECKFWHGIEEFYKAISQLFDRYLTWRDSKAALIVFVQNKGFSNVLETIKSNILNHEYAIRKVEESKESSFSYIFRLPSDEEKEVMLEVICFHFVEE